MVEAAEASDVSEDGLLGGAVRLLQPRRGHRAGTDAVLLAAFAAVRPGERVVDLGSASGAVGLMIAHRAADATIVFVERDPALVALCRRNIALNGIGARAEAVEADVFGPMPILEPQSADVVATNPPFFDEGQRRTSPDPGRRAAHRMEGGDLSGWIAAARRLLRPKGRLCLIHRADSLGACLASLKGFGGIAVTPIHPAADAPAIRIVVSATNAARAASRLMPPLILHEADGSFTPHAEALHAA